MNDIRNLPFTITAIHEAYRQGISPKEVVKEVYRRIDETGDPGIFIHLIDEKQALDAAGKLGAFELAAKQLWGIPFVIKDNIDAAGHPTTAACPDFSYVPKQDAHVVRLLRLAGAILIGKTNLDQFATGLVGVRSPYPIPKNAIDPEIVPGGSSSGSAVAVARGLVTFSLGTDTAGSGRIPAGLNNIVGLKPSLGSLSASGVVPACRTLDTVSIFALTVEDAFAAFTAAAEFDPADAYSRPFKKKGMTGVQPSFTVGVPSLETREFFGDSLQAQTYSQALLALEKIGAEIIELDFTPFYDVAKMLYEGAWVAERYAAIEKIVTENPDALFPVTRQIIGSATRLSAADAFKGMYRLADLKRSTEPLVASVDVLCVPTMPTFYSLSDLDADPIGPNSRLGTYTNFVNLMDLCGIAVPAGKRRDGRPGSVTLLAKCGEDAKLASLASVFHRSTTDLIGATGWHLPEAGVPAALPSKDEIAVAMVGAHMSGLPLNHEVTGRGGRFLYASETAPEYRFYSLAGGPPKRPGLVRSRDGAAISLEVWALPLQKFGAFMAGIPQPLGIGTINLANGEKVKGFLCESAGLDGAEDITSFGGWRAYLASLSAMR
jgi:allophanate hydrolase